MKISSIKMIKNYSGKHSLIAGFKTSRLSRKELTDYLFEVIETSSERDRSFTVFDINGHAISLAYSDDAFKKNLSNADLIHADGQSIVIISKYLSKNKIEERSATTDLIHDLCSQSKQKNRHYLLGGETEVVEKCGAMLSEMYDTFELAGTHHGFFTESEEAEIVASINNSNAQFLWVGLGKPKEQAFVEKWKHTIQIPVSITCGGCFNYVTGDYSRAPELMQKLGLEWLYRMLTSPKKLLIRYLTTNPHAIYCALKYRESKSSKVSELN